MTNSDRISKPTPKPKLIFLWTYTAWGGAQIYFFAIMKLAMAEWDIVVILPKQSKRDLLDLLDQLGVRVEFLRYHLDPVETTSVYQKAVRHFERIRVETEAFLALLKYDLRKCVLQIDSAPWQSSVLLGLLAARGSNTFVTLHNLPPKVAFWRRSIFRFRFWIVTRLPRFRMFTSNKITRDQIKPWVPASFWDSIKVTYSGVAADQISTVLNEPDNREQLRKSAGIPLEKRVVLAVGQFVDRKGRWVFLEAASRVLADRDDVVFVWLMSDLPAPETENRIREFGLGKAFIPVAARTLGKDRLSFLRFYRVGDIFTLPSFIEGLPIALLEAMALGVPTISTSVYAIPEAVKNETTGLLIPPGDAESLASAILRLLDDPDLRRELGRKGMSYVLENFDERVGAEIALETYRQVVGAAG